MNITVNFSELKGKTLKEIRGLEAGNDNVRFITEDGDVYRMFHDQECCEDVRIEDVCGDIDDLVGSEILMAEEASNSCGKEGKLSEYDEFYTWTFYKLATIKGYVTIRWYGTSNGYYSEDVDFVKVVQDYHKKFWK